MAPMAQFRLPGQARACGRRATSSGAPAGRRRPPRRRRPRRAASPSTTVVAGRSPAAPAASAPGRSVANRVTDRRAPTASGQSEDGRRCHDVPLRVHGLPVAEDRMELGQVGSGQDGERHGRRRRAAVSRRQARGRARRDEGLPDVAQSRSRQVRRARCRATMPPVRLCQATSAQPASCTRPASAAWSGHARIDSAR